MILKEVKISSISILEADILNIIWIKKKVTVREVYETMLRKEIKNKEKGFIPYTTVMSIMTILTGKGLLKQDKTAKTYIYSADVTRKYVVKSIIKTIADKLLP